MTETVLHYHALRGTVRERLTEDRTYYVATNGNNSNNGLSSSTPLATIQYAYELVVSTLDFGGKNVVIQVADGMYNATNAALLQVHSPWMGGGTLTVQGNLTSPANCVLNGPGNNQTIAISASLPGYFFIKGFKMTAAYPYYCITLQSPGVVGIGDMDFGAAYGHLFAWGTGAYIYAVGNYRISGNVSGNHIQCGNLAVISVVSRTVTINAGLSVNIFAYASRMGLIEAYATTWSGSVTGTKYYVTNNSVIFTNGNPSGLPGSISGVANAGGQAN